jgi:hypothetical protein
VIRHRGDTIYGSKQAMYAEANPSPPIGGRLKYNTSSSAKSH